MAEEEQPLVDPERVQGPGRRTVIVVTFLIAAAGACGLGFVVSSSAAPSHLRATKPWQGAGSEIIQESFTTGSNVNSGNQAGDDIIYNIQKIYPPPKEEKHPEPCEVVEETDDKVVFGNGYFISYTNPKKFEGSFFDKDYNQIKDVKDLPRCLEKLWLVDDELGGELKDLPRPLKNLSLPAGHKQFSGEVHDLPRLLKHLNLETASKQVTGDVRDLPRHLVHLNLHDAPKIRGDVKHLPEHLRVVQLALAPLQGATWNLPSSLTFADFSSSDIEGDVRWLPRGLTWAAFQHDKELTGHIKDLPQHLTYAGFLSGKKIEGRLSEAPNHLKCKRRPYTEMFGGFGGGFRCF